MKSQTTVLEVGGLHWATSVPIVEKTLSRRPGVLAVEANATSQTANVTYDPDQTSVAQLVGWVNHCGYHCAGQSVPDHMCDPMTEPTTRVAQPQAGREAHAGHVVGEDADRSEQAVMGHGGAHGGGSMEDMA
ncbi:MAG: cation transporter, partial [Actinomycetales bacterium]|nr:cation transporter [Actinomycetales bacterium]